MSLISHLVIFHLLFTPVAKIDSLVNAVIAFSCSKRTILVIDYDNTINKKSNVTRSRAPSDTKQSTSHLGL